MLKEIQTARLKLIVHVRKPAAVLVITNLIFL